MYLGRIIFESLLHGAAQVVCFACGSHIPRARLWFSIMSVLSQLPQSTSMSPTLRRRTLDRYAAIINAL